jgi:NADH:ubiquinone oxidoreductase subunit H
LLIALLVSIRGGIPRYRYDFLTKIGWIKFLSLVIAVFLSSLLLVVVM